MIFGVVAGLLSLVYQYLAPKKVHPSPIPTPTRTPTSIVCVETRGLQTSCRRRSTALCGEDASSAPAPLEAAKKKKVG